MLCLGMKSNGINVCMCAQYSVNIKYLYTVNFNVNLKVQYKTER